MPRRSAALTLAALSLALTFAVVGCTAPGSTPPPAASPSHVDESGDGGQSTADACAIVQQSIDDATAAFSDSSLDDPASVVEAMQAASRELETVSARVTNDEVAAIVPSLRELFDQAGQALEAMNSGDVTRLGELNDAAAAFGETTARFEELCATA